MLRACVSTGCNGINYFLAIGTMLGLSSLAIMFMLDIINKPTKVWLSCQLRFIPSSNDSTSVIYIYLFVCKLVFLTTFSVQCCSVLVLF